MPLFRVSLHVTTVVDVFVECDSETGAISIAESSLNLPSEQHILTYDKTIKHCDITYCDIDPSVELV